MALKDAYVLKEDRAIGSQWSTEMDGPDTDVAAKGQAYSPVAIPPEAKPPSDPEHYGPVQPGTVKLSLEDWNLLEDIIGSSYHNGPFQEDERVLNILKAVREGMRALRVK